MAICSCFSTGPSGGCSATSAWRSRSDFASASFLESAAESDFNARTTVETGCCADLMASLSAGAANALAATHHGAAAFGKRRLTLTLREAPGSAAPRKRQELNMLKIYGVPISVH